MGAVEVIAALVLGVVAVDLQFDVFGDAAQMQAYYAHMVSSPFTLYLIPVLMASMAADLLRRVIQATSVRPKLVALAFIGAAPYFEFVLKPAEQALVQLKPKDLAVGQGEELAAEELRRAATSLGRLLGRVDVEDILDVIFREFCVGK